MIFDPMFIYFSCMMLGVAAAVMALISRGKFQIIWFLRRAEVMFAIAIPASAFLPLPSSLWAVAIVLLMLTTLVLAVKEADYRKYLENQAQSVSTEKEE